MSRNETTQALGVALLLIGSVFAGAATLGATGSAVAQSNSASFVTVDDTVRVHQAEDVAIRGETALESGTNISVIAEADTDQATFIIPVEATVGDDGTFEATLSFDDYPVGTEFTVRAVHDGTLLAESDAKIVSDEKTLYPTTTEETATTDESSSGASSPGFGLGVALLTVCGAVFVFSQRR